jgi:hypothetical protein
MGWLSPLSPTACRAPHEIAHWERSARVKAVQDLGRRAPRPFLGPTPHPIISWMDSARRICLVTRQQFCHLLTVLTLLLGAGCTIGIRRKAHSPGHRQRPLSQSADGAAAAKGVFAADASPILAATKSPVIRPTPVRSARRRCATASARRPTCMTAVSRRSRRSWSSTTRAGSLIRTFRRRSGR